MRWVDMFWSLGPVTFNLTRTITTITNFSVNSLKQNLSIPDSPLPIIGIASNETNKGHVLTKDGYRWCSAEGGP